MENRNGLVVDVKSTLTGTKVERDTALVMVDRLKKKMKRKGATSRTVGGDKGYHSGEFVRDLRKRKIKPHLAMVNGRKTPGLDGRTTRRQLRKARSMPWAKFTRSLPCR